MVSLAEQKFASLAEKFLKDAFHQMGVHIFMMIGYQDQNGKMLRSKYVLFFVFHVGTGSSTLCQIGDTKSASCVKNIYTHFQHSWRCNLGCI
jgi:hypothetical protein